MPRDMDRAWVILASGSMTVTVTASWGRSASSLDPRGLREPVPVRGPPQRLEAERRPPGLNMAALDADVTE